MKLVRMAAALSIVVASSSAVSAKTPSTLDRPVMLVLSTPWCSHCQKMQPIIDELTKQAAGVLVVLNIDADKNKEAVKYYGVDSVPTYIIYKGERLIDTRTGEMDLMELKKWIARSLNQD